MFYLDPAYLAKCEQLRLPGGEASSGTIVARGFADLGSEVFVALPGNRICSLFTGEQSVVEETHQHFFFQVPDAEALVESIIRSGADIEQIEFVDQREWSVLVQVEAGKQFQAVSRKLVLALIDVLLQLKERELPDGS